MKVKLYCSRLWKCIIVLIFLPTLIISQNEQVEIQDQYHQEMDDLMKNPHVQEAFQIILRDDKKSFEDLIKLTEIAAPPFKEQERAKYFLKILEEAGVDSSWIDKVGNVIALRKGLSGDKTIALDAHTDTVFPEGTDVSTTVVNDTIFAPGVGDDTRGMVMLLAILRAMNEAKLQTASDILFIGSVGEEGLGDLRGVKELFSEDGVNIDSWISIDGGELGRVNYKGLGSYRFRIIFKGPGGHSWGAFGLANPHHAMASAINHFVLAANEYTSMGPKTSYNVGRMGGGTSVNSIPFSSWMEVDIRSLVPERLDDMEEILRAAVQKGLEEQNLIRREGRPLIVEIEMIGKRPSGELSPETPLIQRALAACDQFNVMADHTRGSTNSNIPISLGIPAVTIGRGGSGGWAHSLLEWWANIEGHKAVQYALLVLLAESGLVN